ncbi:DUF2062 domain-containing protein [Hymenobacter coccineus]|uniref:DUF2062 domain-containing protein n=1 Tax=Hymenobacter coccineus TaxID=1908235 RepID=A0A1G1TE33_9BACT|nr:DUF2062 domain-containing protein [Hymenobacter coccineus]OGX89142.1 hypothetical protein BEN49_09770 [Hymenobacter coccineus]
MTVASASSAPAPPEGPTARPGWLRRVLLDPLLNLLKAGLSPGQLALTVGLGAALGVAPTFGLTTLIATGVALRLRLNVAALQLICHLLTPVQLLLLLPLLRYGGELLGQGNALAHFTLSQLQYQVRHEPLVILRLLWRAELGALLIWAVAAVPVVALLYFGLRPVFRRVVRKHEATEALATPVAEQ